MDEEMVDRRAVFGGGAKKARVRARALVIGGNKIRGGHRREPKSRKRNSRQGKRLELKKRYLSMTRKGHSRESRGVERMKKDNESRNDLVGASGGE